MRPWNYDGGAVNYADNILEDVYLNRPIRNYLNVTDHDHQFYLVGAKGAGKTLFLNIKSQLFNERMRDRGLKRYPTGANLCENLLIQHGTFSKQDLIKFASTEMWTRIWTFALCIVSCQTHDIELPADLLRRIDHARSLTSIITQILVDRSNTNDYFEFLPTLISKIELIQSGMGIFIDNVDQCFESILQESHPSDYDESSAVPISVKVWTNAQTGLIAAIYQLNRHNSHIKIYTTIRNEVFNSMETAMRFNYQSFATFIKYTKEEIKEIFEINIRIQEKEEGLFFPGGKTPVERFLGFEDMLHLFAKDASAQARVEQAFDFLYRHSYGRPREIVIFGNMIYNQIPTELKNYRHSLQNKAEDIRFLINEESAKVLNTYLEELIPRFDKEEFSDFLCSVQCNVIPQEWVTDKLKAKMRKYFAYGLIGYTQAKPGAQDDELVQVFRPVATYSYQDGLGLPPARYYLIHPSIDYAMQQLFGLSFYNRHNIIGDGYPFFDLPNLSRIYDVALSFAGENRAYVEEVTKSLTALNVKVFYDDHQRIELWGKNLFAHLQKVYRLYAQHCVIFVSEHYLRKEYTLHEFKAAELRAFRQADYILPVTVDGKMLPSDWTDVHHLSAEEYSPRLMAEAIKMKLDMLRQV